MLGLVHTVLFRAALVVTLLFMLVATGLTVTRSRLEPVLSGSMTPAIPRHSLILAVPVATSDLRVGDVVVFQPPGSQSSVMHRVVELSGGNMRTKGDANAVIDPWTIDLGASGVFRVRAAVPRAGVALEFLHNTTRHTGGEMTWPGLLLLIGAIAYAVRLRRRRPDDEDDEDDEVAELRAAGRGIAGCVERLEKADLDPEQAQIVRTIGGHAERITRLTAEPDEDGYVPRHARGDREDTYLNTAAEGIRPPGHRPVSGYTSTS